MLGVLESRPDRCPIRSGAWGHLSSYMRLRDERLSRASRWFDHLSWASKPLTLVVDALLQKKGSSGGFQPSLAAGTRAIGVTMLEGNDLYKHIATRSRV